MLPAYRSVRRYGGRSETEVWSGGLLLQGRSDDEFADVDVCRLCDGERDNVRDSRGGNAELPSRRVGSRLCLGVAALICQFSQG